MRVSAPKPDAWPSVALRPPDTVMRLERMGSFFPTRLSFMRILLRALASGGFRFSRERFDIDADGYGAAVYRVAGPGRGYSLAAFSRPLADADRTDRVIATAWDAAFVLFDGDPSPADLARLTTEVPLQEAGRFRESELVLCRANRSMRFFDHVVERLAQGRQPDARMLAETGYLMRTTAVYGNGKFGIADRFRIAGRAELSGPFQAEMLAVYLVRCFTIDLVEHIARARAPDKAVGLAPEIRRHLGIGNATGLGMAPFLMTHPRLVHRWMLARETALARLRAAPPLDASGRARLGALLARARRHVAEWQVADERQMRRIEALRLDLAHLAARTHASLDDLHREAEVHCGLEAQELAVSLILEFHPERTEDLAPTMSDADPQVFDAAMKLKRLAEILDRHYAWTHRIDTGDPLARRLFWYVSEEKLEPRLGDREVDDGAERERPFAIAHDVARLRAAIAAFPPDATAAELAMAHPGLRHIMKRVQLVADNPYGGIRDNLTGQGCRPIDLLRCKLSFFGASKFDPKSDRWTRITLFQGAPFPDELDAPGADDWAFPALA